MRLLDVGCGWGSMAIHAAKTYGARVVGITISQEQAERARERVGRGRRRRARRDPAAGLPRPWRRDVRRDLVDRHVRARRRGTTRRVLRCPAVGLVPDGPAAQPRHLVDRRFAARPPVVHRSLRVPRRRAHRRWRSRAGDGARRLRSPRRRVASRALRAHAARMGGQPRGRSGTTPSTVGDEPQARVWRLYMAAPRSASKTAGSACTKSSASCRRRPAKRPSRPPAPTGSERTSNSFPLPATRDTQGR